MPGLHSDKSKDKDRAFSHGSGGAAADSAVEGRPKLEDRHIQAPHSRKAKRPLAENEKHDQLAAKERHIRERHDEDRQEVLLDEGLEESFPSSDPPSVKRIT